MQTIAVMVQPMNRVNDNKEIKLKMKDTGED